VTPSLTLLGYPIVSIDPGVSWDACKADFEADGSLRDIYVLGTTLEDWRAVLSLVTAPPYAATMDGEDASDISANARALLAHPAPHLLSIRVGRVDLCCHFFSENEVEFDFVPNGLTEDDLSGLLTFMTSLGRLTGKLVVMTPENVPTHPIFRFDPQRETIEYLPPG
jgi:hypothetical protein